MTTKYDTEWMTEIHLYIIIEYEERKMDIILVFNSLIVPDF